MWHLTQKHSFQFIPIRPAKIKVVCHTVLEKGVGKGAFAHTVEGIESGLDSWEDNLTMPIKFKLQGNFHRDNLMPVDEEILHARGILKHQSCRRKKLETILTVMKN